jgi:hypothetical protein
MRCALTRASSRAGTAAHAWASTVRLGRCGGRHNQSAGRIRGVDHHGDGRAQRGCEGVARALRSADGSLAVASAALPHRRAKSAGLAQKRHHDAELGVASARIGGPHAVAPDYLVGRGGHLGGPRTLRHRLATGDAEVNAWNGLRVVGARLTRTDSDGAHGAGDAKRKVASPRPRRNRLPPYRVHRAHEWRPTGLRDHTKDVGEANR